MTIRIDASRQKIRPNDPRKPRAPVFRQGQVLLDAELDQAARLILERGETGDADIFAAPGRLVAPNGDPGFQVSLAGANIRLAAGRGYLGGWLLENTALVTLATQPNPWTGAAPQTPMALVIKALIRNIDPVEETAWADPALGDAQTGGRALTDWHVFPIRIASGLDCATLPQDPAWQELTAASTGTLRVGPAEVIPASDPCSLVPRGGFSRGENLLYRIEVHGGTAIANAPVAAGLRYGLNGLRVKLSRRNASVLVRLVSVTGTEITVTPPALDPLNWFAPGQFAELVRPGDDLVPPDPAGAGERLFRVLRATDTTVTLDNAASGILSGLAAPGEWFLRLWDSFNDSGASGAVTVDTTGHPTTSQEIDIGDGLRIWLGGSADARFRRGDYWTFAARSDGSIDWPPGAAELPHGPETRFAPLAVIAPGALQPLEDCRITAGSLTDRVLHYRGGDGQEVLLSPGVTHIALPAPLRVAVMRGRHPVQGARVLWRPVNPDIEMMIDNMLCSRANPISLPTGADGVSQIRWSINAGLPHTVQGIEAVLLTATGAEEPQPIRFTAGFRTATQTAYFPGECKLLSDQFTVQDALDKLCANIGDQRQPDVLTLTRITLHSGGYGTTELLQEGLILNGMEGLPNIAFDKGIEIRTDSPELMCQPKDYDPIIEVGIDLPYPTTNTAKRYWHEASGGKLRQYFGFKYLRLEGHVQVDRRNEKLGAGLFWQPSEGTMIFLNTLPNHMGGQERLNFDNWEGPKYKQLLCRLRIRSAHVWGQHPETKGLAWLNAEHLGYDKGQTQRELLLDERDPQRAGDLEMFFYILIQ
ncbi:DUF6519 domain-containing protein [Pseudogemmobacter bohemicus]|uniref:DUF6519 domain-containing protein n=1 Tax=Pseudogemmobacter bohemicus TaxID=2250708 RepID=UPI000DD488D1|nr:DUF6519 domain-containing protein [Pseudogemmobacter bohemicus]